MVMPTLKNMEDMYAHFLMHYSLASNDGDRKMMFGGNKNEELHRSQRDPWRDIYLPLGIYHIKKGQ